MYLKVLPVWIIPTGPGQFRCKRLTCIFRNGTADVDANGERIFVVGDVHGCALHLNAWLAAAEQLANHDGSLQRLIFLGDLINRGPASVATLRLWASERPIPGVNFVHRLMGNHEQLLVMAAGRSASRATAYRKFVELGGSSFVWELAGTATMPEATTMLALLTSTLGNEIWSILRDQLEAAVRVGNLVFVHAGVDPSSNVDEFLALPADVVPDDHRHWAWIENHFLLWRHGFGGLVIVHGHVPPAKHRALTGRTNPHLLHGGRLCLDGGSATTGVVAGAQIKNGRYRIIRAISSER